MKTLFDLERCSNCGQMHDLCFKGHYFSPTGSYWFICPNGDKRVEFKSVKASTMECPRGSIECFCADDDGTSSTCSD